MKYRNTRKAILAVIVTMAWAMLTPALTAQAPRRIEIQAKRFQYTPSEITLKKGEPVILVFHSEDVTHGFKLKEFNIKVEIPKHGTTEVPFTPNVAGDFVAKCSHFCGMGHGDMKLKIHVTE